MSRERNIIFSSNKKIHQLQIKHYFMTENNFVAEVTFKDAIIYGIFDIIFQTYSSILKIYSGIFILVKAILRTLVY